MKSKIFAKLKQEYSSLGLGDEVLMALAESLAATGLVTDDNIDAVVSYQRGNLETLQKHNNKRVTDALEKERKKNAEDTAKKKAEEEAAKAKEEAERKAKEEAEKNKGNKGGDPTEDPRLAEFERRLNEMSEESKKRETAYATEKAELEKRIKELSDESAATKAEKAKADRQAKILSMAKELGVPQWRIDEGFAIADDATDEAIKTTLSMAANNVKTNLLPGSKAHSILGGGEATKEEISSLAATLVK